MRILQTAFVGLAALPCLAIAHPGHFDHTPFAHDLSHGLIYFAAMVAVYFGVKQQGAKLLRLLDARRRKGR